MTMKYIYIYISEIYIYGLFYIFDINAYLINLVYKDKKNSIEGSVL